MSEQTGPCLPWWDYLILPALSLLTAIVVLASAEFTARAVWPKNPVDSCLVREGSSLHYKPDCVSRMKIPEGPWILNEYNDCGLQSGFPCRPKPAGTIRIAILGSSSAQGYMVPYQQSYASGMEEALTQQCDRIVQVQNLAVAGSRLSQAVGRTDEALALNPDLVLLVLTPYDLWKEIGDAEPENPGAVQAQPATKSNGWDLRTRLEPLKQVLRDSSALIMLRHFLYQDPQIYLNFYLMSDAGGADFLKVPFPPRWQEGFEHLDALLGNMVGQMQARGIPFAIVPAFHRPQVALMNAGNAFPDKDPYAFEKEIAKLAERHGIIDLEVTEDFRRADQTERLFYLADGHLEPRGHEVLARALTRQILQSQILGAARCTATPLSTSLATP